MRYEKLVIHSSFEKLGCSTNVQNCSYETKFSLSICHHDFYIQLPWKSESATFLSYYGEYAFCNDYSFNHFVISFCFLSDIRRWDGLNHSLFYSRYSHKYF